MKRQWGIGVGSASILIIFVLLCLTVFATLSLVSAQADLRLAERAAETTAAYYEADGKACELYTALSDAAQSTNNPALLVSDLDALPHADASALLTPETTALLGDSLVSCESRGPRALAICYAVPIDTVRAIEVTLLFDFASADQTGKPLPPVIEGWRTVQTGGWAEEEATLELWQSGLAGMPNLEG